jgi:hypothetical protein
MVHKCKKGEMSRFRENYLYLTQKVQISNLYNLQKETIRI